MKKQIQQLIEFHQKYNIPYRTEFQLGLSESDEKNYLLRKRIMLEELNEWYEAANCESLIEYRAKELADLLYTVVGTIITEGLQDVIERVFDAVHESNMSKGTNGKPVLRADGKILKGEDYKEPDLCFLLNTEQEAQECDATKA